jgi:NitT/TauT family transport system permease protein
VAIVTSTRDGSGLGDGTRGESGRRRRRSFGRSRTATIVLPLAGISVLVVAWWAAVRAFAIQPYLLPSPRAVLEAFQRMRGYLIQQTVYTLKEVLVGFALSVVVAALIALAVRASPIVDKTAYPLVLAVNAIPKVAIAPLLVVWLGFGMVPKSVMVFLICFFPIVISSVSGLGSTPAELIELARSLEARPWKVFIKIRLPHALPQVFVGLKVAMTLAVIGAVIAEYQGGTTAGLGFIIVQSSGQGDTALAFAAVALLSVMSIVLYYTLVGVEWLLLPWARAERQRAEALTH